MYMHAATTTAAALTIAMSAGQPSNGGVNEDNPHLLPDETWVSLSGTAVDAGYDRFELDYGEGVIEVEMDDWDWYAESYDMLEGDKVTVYGKVDENFFTADTIEASSVYVENMGTYFYANASDEEYDDDYNYWIDYSPIIIGQTVARGEVTSVDGREFTINTGAGRINVDTVEMPYNPMDDSGFQTIERGDYVSVTGEMDKDFWDERELEADSIVTLYDDPGAV